ncbi:hypothetical protein HPB51_013037 [Rhipicephalus microplus]|uniref:BBS7 GAE domain-containing protein n=1 Tax=Rhipicephalus microplus TaxID=6941 RepID=A0A9J6F2K0_RHIMP|nr:hypothetical protein HPB51_013037 [Rhipicephalus microplus]
MDTVAGVGGRGTTRRELLSASRDSVGEEVEQLEQKVARERETYQLRTYSSDKGSISAVPFFALDDSFVLHHQDASYVLAIQLQTAIDTVVLQVPDLQSRMFVLMSTELPRDIVESGCAITHSSLGPRWEHLTNERTSTLPVVD